MSLVKSLIQGISNAPAATAVLKKYVSMPIDLSSFTRCCSYSNQSRFKSVSVFGVRAGVGSAITRGRVLCFACAGGMKRSIEGKQLEIFEKVVKRKIV